MQHITIRSRIYFPIIFAMNNEKNVKMDVKNDQIDEINKNSF